MTKEIRYIEEDRGFRSPCWIWQLSKGRGGYGLVNINGNVMHAHRHYYQEAHGPIDHSLDVDHLCRVHDCVNPDHLEAVSHAENCRRGVKAKLSADDAKEIRVMRKMKVFTDAQIAAVYGVSLAAVRRIVRNEAWI